MDDPRRYRPGPLLGRNTPAAAPRRRTDNMARRALHVTFTKKDPAQLPDVVAEGVALLVTLVQRGLLESIAQKVRIRRQGGYAGIDAVIVLMLYFASGQDVGMRAVEARLPLSEAAGRRCGPQELAQHLFHFSSARSGHRRAVAPHRSLVAVRGSRYRRCSCTPLCADL